MIFMEKVDLSMQVNLTSVIMDWKKGRMRLSFYAKRLIPGYLNDISGEYATPEGHSVDEKEAEEFDKMFPYSVVSSLESSFKVCFP